MEFKDYYARLGVEKTATQDDIKRAYRKLARKYHPDVSKEANAEAQFKEVAEAYEALKDPEKRAAYDAVGSEHGGEKEFRPPPGWDSGFEFNGTGAGADPGHSDFFEALFGRAACAGQPPRHMPMARITTRKSRSTCWMPTAAASGPSPCSHQCVMPRATSPCSHASWK